MTAAADALPFSRDPARRPGARRRAGGAGALSALFARTSSSACGRFDYRELAFAVLSRFIDDIPGDDLQRLIDSHLRRRDVRRQPHHAAVHARAGAAPAARLERPDARFQGHRAAAARPAVRARARASGAARSTSSARRPATPARSAEHAMRGKRGVAVFMLSPHGRMSPFQQAQMYSIADPAIHNLAIDGTFDDCQDIVKAIASDAAFKRDYRLGAVNSINWARVAAQIVYYFSGYFAATRARGRSRPVRGPVRQLRQHPGRPRRPRDGTADLAPDPRDQRERRARRVLPHRPLSASRRRRRRMRRRRRRWTSPRRRTSSASCSTSSGAIPRGCRALWRTLSRDGGFDLRTTPYWDARAGVGHSSPAGARTPNRIATIRDIDARYGVTVDPHTADGLKVGRELRDPAAPLICIETALPAKFAATIREALGREPERPPAFASLEARPQRFEVLPAQAARVQAHIAAHAACS